MEQIECEQNGTSLKTPEAVTRNGESKCLECEICNRIYFTCSKLEKHIRTYHGGKKDTGAHEDKHLSKKFQCYDCLEFFESKKVLEAHEKTHEQRFYVECDFCETFCDNEEELKAHLKSHPNSKKSRDKTKLPPKTIKCKCCRKKFRTEDALKSHFKFCNPSLLSCEKCCKSFSTKPSLKRHSCSMKDAVYKCNVCNESFSKKVDLYQHFFVHKFTQGYDLQL
ncbi:hypothetical protein JTE90_024429 [Oedothorax gibbosus]|uniref:C2H2-type domain-containing protein n=1 Tax=Oedothorax gibbosus TaxID=931172 RepID=A0AAV6UFB9_9ARAC|nr:hypothetical protein JTE90_024429 [Oedothorax gibbosus]